MKSLLNKKISLVLCSLFCMPLALSPITSYIQATAETITLRVHNCEEYIDLGGEDGYLAAESGLENPSLKTIYEDFEDWYRDN